MHSFVDVHPREIAVLELLRKRYFIVDAELRLPGFVRGDPV